MKKKRLWLAVVFATVCALGLLAGCAQDTGSSDKAVEPGSQEPADQGFEPLSLVYLNKAGYETVIVADKAGFFEEAATDIELLTVSGSGQQAVEALLAGSADIAATGQGPVADALGQYGDDIVVLGGTNCNTDSQVWVAGPNLTGDKTIVAYDKSRDNKDEVKASFEAAATALGEPIRLGVQQGATTESAVKSWLGAMGIAFNDYATEGDGVVSLIDVKANTLPTVLSTGTDIDMMAASQPYPSTALASIDGAYRVGSNADTNSYDVACYITTKQVYDAKEDSIKEFMKALSKTTDYMSDAANQDECITWCSDSMGADEETVRVAFELADWDTTYTDTMVESIFKAASKKGYEDVTKESILAANPLSEWLKTDLK